MEAHCKHCHRTHAAWMRLNDGCVCGLCGARERDPRVIPFSIEMQPATPKPAMPKKYRPAVS